MTLLTSAFFYGQEKLEYIDYDTIITKVNALEEKEEYDKMIAHLDKINPNDSLYESSLVTKSYYLLQQKKYDAAIQTAEKGLTISDGSDRYSFLLNKGVAYLRSERYTEALAVYSEAIKEYPKNHVLFYNRGIINERLEKFEEAAKDYMQSIMINPFYADSHLQLGRMCYRENKMSQALMAINMYLLLDPDGENSFSILNSMNVSVSKKNELEPRVIEISPDDEAFEDIDLVLTNGIALNPNYVVDSKINIALTKQNHALLEQLEDFEGNDGFWDQKYVPFYKWIFENGHFNDFTYTISYSIQNEKFKKIVDKNIDKIKVFIDLFYDKWLDIMDSENDQLFEGKKQKVTHVFDNYTLQAVGLSKNGKKIGNWEVYNENGKLEGIGKFDNDGKRIGEWVWYTYSGDVSSTENYKEGKLDGKYTSFYTNGNKETERIYAAGKLNGAYKSYNEKGALVEKKVFANNALNGPYISYHPIGESAKKYVLEYKNGNPEGELHQYYPNGKLFEKRNYTNGKNNGLEYVYHNNDTLKAVYNYVDGIFNGPYKTYYKNGQPYEIGSTVEGYYDGDWKLYHPDGTVMNEFTYNKGELNGSYKEYDVDGKLDYEFFYRNDEFIEYKHFTKSGEILKEAKKKKGEFYYQGYSPLKDLLSEGLYDIKGGKKGEWKYYEDGVLVNKGTYTDNKLNGNYYQYYTSGQKESITEYKNDSLVGYYVGYHKNGNISRQGWYKDGSGHGTWVEYYNDGKIKHKKNYHKGQQHGTQEYYAVDGKLSSTLVFEYGDLVAENHYNATGKKVQEIAYDPTQKAYTITLNLYEGKTYSSIDYLHGIRHGNYVRYNPDGQKLIEGVFFNGNLNGPWTWYHDNGKISMQGSYFYGEFIGEWKTFHENGALKNKYSYELGELNGTYETYNDQGVLTRVIPYKNGKIHGKRMFYSPTGKLQLIRYYHNDKIIGYSYNDTNGNLKPMIALENFTGQIKGYFDNGKPSMELELKNGVFINEFKAYYYNGQLERHVQYKDGDYHGVSSFYYPDGTLKKEKDYRHDLLHGASKKYYPNGKLKEEISYLHDDRNGKATYYDEKGELIKEKSFFNDVQEK